MRNYYRFHAQSRWRAIPFWDPVVGCTPVGRGCANCSSAFTTLRNNHAPDAVSGTPERARWTGRLSFKEDELGRAATFAENEHVFVCGRSDLFHEDLPEDYRQRIFDAAATRPDCTFLFLTKRSQALVGRKFPDNWIVGVSIEDQDTHDKRLPHLAQCEAQLKFVSAKPLLGPITLNLDLFDGICVGGEHGPNSRPCHPDWVRQIRDQVVERRSKAFTFHNWGRWVPGPGRTMIWVDADGGTHEQREAGTTPMHVGTECEIGSTTVDGQAWNEVENIAVRLQQALAERC